jgi:MFS family permease
VRTAPRDALVADSVNECQRGLAFGLHRAADTGGAVVGIILALVVVWMAQAGNVQLSRDTFQKVVLISLVPAFIAVVALAILAQDVPVIKQRQLPKFAFRGLGKQFVIFIIIVSIFDLGNSSDAFLVLRAQDRGASVLGVLGMLVIFNLVYTLASIPFGALSDRVGRRKIIAGGWLLYAFVYLGFAMAGQTWHIWILYALYGLYYGLTYGTSKALVADIVPAELHGTAYGTYNAVLGILDLPASLIAGVLWQGIGRWGGFGASAPFLFGGGLALLAALLMSFWNPKSMTVSSEA